MLDHHFFPDAATALDALEAGVREWNGYADGRIRCWVNIEGKAPCPIDLPVGARDPAERLGVGTTSHLASTIEEAGVSEPRHGRRPIPRGAGPGADRKSAGDGKGRN